MEFVLLVIGFVLLCCLIFAEDMLFREAYKLLCGIVSIICIYFGAYIVGSDTAYKEALKGNNIYKMEVKYELKDSMYVPSDTVFVLINKNDK